MILGLSLGSKIAGAIGVFQHGSTQIDLEARFSLIAQSENRSYTHRVLALAMDGTAETFARTDGLPCGLGFLPDGRLLITSMLDRKILQRELDGSLVEHADLSALAPWQLNDMLVDHEGRAWVGNFGFDLMGGAQVCTTVLKRADLIAFDPEANFTLIPDLLHYRRKISPTSAKLSAASASSPATAQSPELYSPSHPPAASTLYPLPRAVSL